MTVVSLLLEFESLSCRLRFGRLVDALCCCDQPDEDVRPPCVNKAAGDAAKNQTPHGDAKCRGIRSNRTGFHLPGVVQRRENKNHKGYKSKKTKFRHGLNVGVMDDKLIVAAAVRVTSCI